MAWDRGDHPPARLGLPGSLAPAGLLTASVPLPGCGCQLRAGQGPATPRLPMTSTNPLLPGRHIPGLGQTGDRPPRPGPPGCPLASFSPIPGDPPAPCQPPRLAPSPTALLPAPGHTPGLFPPLNLCPCSLPEVHSPPPESTPMDLSLGTVPIRLAVLSGCCLWCPL